jgi:hypothetical protein
MERLLINENDKDCRQKVAAVLVMVCVSTQIALRRAGVLAHHAPASPALNGQSPRDDDKDTMDYVIGSTPLLAQSAWRMCLKLPCCLRVSLLG